jgi:predicted transglutaminase-like cysteine proteinase
MRIRPAISPSQSAVYSSFPSWKILIWLGLLLAIALCSLDPLDLLSGSAAPICLLAADYVGSDAPAGRQSDGELARSDRAATGDENTALLFEMETEPVDAGGLVDKWLSVEADIARELEVIVQCRAGKPCPAPAHELIELTRDAAGRNMRARVGMINRAVDLAVRPVSDDIQWGAADHWSDPFETLQSKSGDCEDYAIVKYAALLAAGLSRDSLRIVILRNRLPNEDHAVVAVRVDQQWLILDNRTLTLVRDVDVTRAIPEFALDDRGVRRFVWSSRTRRVS